MPLVPALWRQLLCLQRPKKLLIAQEGDSFPLLLPPMPVNIPLDGYVLTITGSEQTAMEQYSLLGEGMDSQRTRQDQDLCLEAGIVHVPFEVPISISTVLSSYVVTTMEFKIPCGSAPSSLLTLNSILYNIHNNG